MAELHLDGLKCQKCCQTWSIDSSVSEVTGKDWMVGA
jgi:hypothetical protein